ncbi:uncharacterized protein LOC117236869 isoform X1 [Bombus vosnesenskii]|uniref:Uncharacterized protein LOC117236869 isoform X1 n=2 Tax=Bombus vosnesenskii TaxID=207650 RepID=A0A6J3KSU0_9HYME|nr:uncharacterized protein LOC117236869 isoform X1 [Bombus vosnesenskii]
MYKHNSSLSMENHTEAISFANSYFALVDGLVSGLENQLSEDVVLYWFGSLIKGRKHVSTFLRSRKLNSRHIFSHIISTTDINYEKESLTRNKLCSCHYRKHQECQTRHNNFVNDNSTICEPFLQKMERSLSMCDVITDINHNEIHTKEIGAVDDTFYNLSEGDLSNLFKLDILSTDIEEIEHSINRIKLKEEVVPTIKRKCSRRDKHDIVQVKYVEANGEVEFSRKFWKLGSWKTYISRLSTATLYTWKRPCKLQIAYTISSQCQTLEQSCETKNVTVSFVQPKVRLPSLQEINEITSRLVPNTNEFGGFLKDADFFEDYKGFLGNVKMEMAINDPCMPLSTAQYVKNKLVFNKPSINMDDRNGKGKKKFAFNYQIHLIIYQDIDI